MIRSMTAFASGEREIRDWLFTWEVRSVNHRYLDLSLRLPDAFRFLEPAARSRVGALINRGRLDCILSYKKSVEGGADIRMNRELVTKLLATAREVDDLSDRPLAGFSALDVLKWPGALHEPETDREQLAAEILDLLTDVLKQAIVVRENEGRQLAALLKERCVKLREHVSSVRARMPEVLQSIRQKIMARLAEVCANPDSERLEQEMVYLAQKLDVDEELDRLDAHVDEVLRALRQKEPVGRRLDFLLQEMNREANTLGSKSADAETTKASVEMKVLIEQMREQTQNIE
jgi:uncharacterized protein (TIGR00255 family)